MMVITSHVYSRSHSVKCVIYSSVCIVREVRLLRHHKLLPWFQFVHRSLSHIYCSELWDLAASHYDETYLGRIPNSYLLISVRWLCIIVYTDKHSNFKAKSLKNEDNKNAYRQRFLLTQNNSGTVLCLSHANIVDMLWTLLTFAFSFLFKILFCMNEQN